MNLKILLLTLGSVVFATLVTRSQTDPFAPPEREGEPPRLIRVQAEFIELPLATYTNLMTEPRSSANDTDLRATCAELVEAGRARIIETGIIITPPGTSSASENISEFIYPTEWEPPVLPNKIGPGQTQYIPPPLPPGVMPPASAFDTKNLGSTFNVEGQIGQNHRIVECFFECTTTFHTGDRIWGHWTNGDASAKIKMPQFYTLRTKGSTTMISGQTQMIGALSPKDDQGRTDRSRKVMVFLRADIITFSK